ncbi:MAG TPA: hypothetical protein VNX66_00305 [Candidatus Sulfotelmatobacter sp.]|jgi:hypothetical protein|nr:hypothetical protein [Candidatus Sulfotelmatobacter sp.]
MKASLALAALLLTASISSANPNHARHNVYVDGWHNHCYEPSTYMEYNDGLALGKQQLAEQAAPKKPLGDIARTATHSPHRHPASNAGLQMRFDLPA